MSLFISLGVVLVFIFFGAAKVAKGDAMSSPNYHIQRDSLNFGGDRSISNSYRIEDTAGEVATGLASSTNFILKAGYQQLNDVFISVSTAPNVIMSPALAGVTGGTSNGSTTFTVTTDSQSGYSATIVASSSPALISGANSFADYLPSGANPDFTFANAATASSFAFSPEGTDIAPRFKDDGATCGTGSADTALSCWDGLSTSPKTVLTRLSSNQPTGTPTTLRFRAASGASHIQTSGTYTATTTITVVPL